MRVPVIATHITGWLFFQCLPLAFLLSQPGNPSLFSVLSSFEYWQFCIYYAAIFYCHSYFLLPTFLNKQKWIRYIAALLVLLCSVISLQPFEKLLVHTQNRPGIEMSRHPPEQEPFSPPPHNRGGMERKPPRVDIISLFLFIMTIMFSFAVDITRKWRLTEQRAIRAEADKANAELSFLKAQINPHFLFNTLNNIYSMAIMQNEHTADTIMKLSNIMRYVTDDVQEDYVSLQSEVDCISDYIDLQRLRLGKKVNLEYSVSGNLEGKKIAPLLLMTFIENVFKYGISNHEPSKLIIKLDTDDRGIHFFAQNQLFAVQRKDDRTGIGIRNTEKRLEHLYAGKYILAITRENGLFTVDLSIYEK